jgi:hypothetical protein
MGDLDIGTLTGKVEIEDQLSSTLEMLSHKIEEFGAHFEGVMGSLAIGAAAAVTAVSAVTGAIVALGVKGSEINDVSSSFDRLAGSTANAAAILEEMRKGTVGTVNDLELMTMANKTLQSGVAANAATFGTMTKAARVLSIEGYGSIPDVLAQIDRGMQTGIMRGPLLKALHVDLTSAERSYMDALGKTGQEMTKANKLAADRGAMMKAFQGIVTAAGEQELTFGERIKAAGVAVENWGIQLAQQVAKSPHVTAALDAIGKAITDNFGGVGQTALETITGWINTFADEVAKWGPVVIKWVSDFIDKVKEIYKTIKDYWDTAPQWFKNIATEAALAGGSVYLVSKALQGATGPDILSSMANLAQVWSVVGENIMKASAAVKEWTLFIAAFKMEGVTVAVTAFGEALLALAATPLGIAALITGLAVAIFKVGEAVHDAYKWWQEGKPMWDFFTQKEDDNFIRRWLGLSHALDTTAESMAYLNSQRGMLEGMMKKPSTGGPAPTAGAPPPPPAAAAMSSGAAGLLDSLKGRDLQAQVNQANEALEGLGMTSLTTIMRLDDLTTMESFSSVGAENLGKKMSDLRMKGVELDGALEHLADVYDDLQERDQRYKESLAEHTRRVAEAAKAETLMASNMDQIHKNSLAITASNSAAEQSAFQRTIAYDQAVMNSSFSTYDQIEAASRDYYATKEAMENASYKDAIAKQDTVTRDLVASVQGQDEVAEELRAQWTEVGNAAKKALDIKHDTDQAALNIDHVNDALKRSHDRYGDTIQAMQRLSDEAGRTYMNMVMMDQMSVANGRGHLFTVQQLATAYQTWAKTVTSLFAQLHPGWQTLADDVAHAGDSISEIGQSIGSTFVGEVGKAVGSMSQFITSLRDATALRAAWAANAKSGSGPTNAQQAGMPGAGGTFAAGAIGAIGAGASAPGVGAGIMNVGMGAATMTATMIAMNTATVAASVALGAATFGIGAAVVGLMAWYKHSQAQTDTQKKLNVEVEAMNKTVIDTYGTTYRLATDGSGRLTKATTDYSGSLDIASKKAAELGLSVGDLTGSKMHHSQEDLKRVNDQLQELADTLKEVASDAQNLGLTWADMDPGHATDEAAKSAQGLLREYDLLTRSGYKVDAVTRQMAPGVNEWLNSALKAGAQIPPAMRPIIESLIKTHQLTEANAKALMGIADDGVPALSDVTDAASRYGLSLDSLGPKVQSLRITDQSNQIVSDYNTLIAAGANFNQIIATTATTADGTVVNFDAMSASAQAAFFEAGGKAEGMGLQIQGIVTAALNAGVAIPEGMKPIVQAMVDQGRLVDASGNKLTDLSKLTFEKPIADKIDDLITKLGEFIDKVGGTDGVSDATTDAANATATQTGNMAQNWGIVTGSVEDYIAAIRKIPPIPTGPPGQPTNRAGGGVVYAASGWASTGSDTIPAMLTPGERVLTVEQNRAFERALSVPTPSSMPSLPDDGRREQVIAVSAPVVIQIGREEIARAVVKTFVTAGGFA